MSEGEGGGGAYGIFRWNEWTQWTTDISDTKTTNALIPYIEALSMWYSVNYIQSTSDIDILSAFYSDLSKMLKWQNSSFIYREIKSTVQKNNLS